MNTVAIAIIVFLGVTVNSIDGKPWQQYIKSNDVISYDQSNDVISFDHDESQLSDVSLNLDCDLCKVLVGVIDDLIDANRTEEEVVVIATEICIALKIESERVCRLVTKEYKVRTRSYVCFSYSSTF